MNPLDVNELASAIQALVTNPGRAAEFGAAGRRRAESKFEISDMTDRNLAVLRSMTAFARVKPVSVITFIVSTVVVSGTLEGAVH